MICWTILSWSKTDFLRRRCCSSVAGYWARSSASWAWALSIVPVELVHGEILRCLKKPPRQTKEQKKSVELSFDTCLLGQSDHKKTHLGTFWLTIEQRVWNEGVWKLQNMDDTWLWREKIGIWRVEEERNYDYNKYLVLYTAENMWSLPALLLFGECINSLCGQKCLLYCRSALLISLVLGRKSAKSK